MTLEITSEAEYKKAEQQLIAASDHPLFGECSEYFSDYEQTLAALDKWREKHPEKTGKERALHDS